MSGINKTGTPRTEPNKRGPDIKTIECAFASQADEVLRALDSSAEGLSDSQAAERLAQYGTNELPTRKGESTWQRLLAQFRNVLIYVLFVSALVSLAMGHWLDSGVILAVVLINGLVGFIQEGKAEKALSAILKMTLTQSLVMREGNLISVDSSRLVPGDIVTLQSGDRVPADLRLILVKGLRCDESALTGESQPVDKQIDPVILDTSMAERTSMAYMGTMVTSGVAHGVVCDTSIHTEIGKISELVQQAVQLETPLQKQLQVFASQLSAGIVLIALLSMVFGVLVHGFAFTDMLQAAIGVAVASIPEGLPAIVTITLAIGVQRMSQRKALVRRLPGVEVLGSVDIICTDKTGTLTTNEMTARQLVTAAGLFTISGEGYQPAGNFHVKDSHDVARQPESALLKKVCQTALFCNNASLKHSATEWQMHGDPTEGALLVMACKYGLTRDTTGREWPRLDELPFDAKYRYMATLHHDANGNKELFVKGASEQILSFCKTQLEESGPVSINTAYWQDQLRMLEQNGMRVMALAGKQVDGNASMASHEQVQKDLVLFGLVGISDPPRPEAVSGIADCKRAGISVKMITGDSPVTAQAIGRELGLASERVLTGRELDKLTHEELAEQIEIVDIFARTSPANKLQLVESLQSRRHVVAMTGDGVNDAPALRQANIGVAMGKKGTDAAREASDIILMDDCFATIASAVQEGRTVYDNIVRSILFILPTSLAEAAVIISAIVAGMVLPITPAQILWVNMITTITLALALAFEKPEAGNMERPPRKENQGLITIGLLRRTLVVGAVSAATIFSVFLWLLNNGYSLELARTVSINTLVMIEAFYLLNCRYLEESIFTWRFLNGSKPVFIAIALVVLLQAIFIYLPVSANLFGLEPLSLFQWWFSVVLAMPVILVVELEKMLSRRLSHGDIRSE